MSINSKLVAFAQNDLVIARNDTERDKINTSLQHLEKVIKDKLGFNVIEFIRFGSYTRNTILPRKFDSRSDVDLMVVFNTSQVKLSPETYRKKLLDVVNTAYPNSVSKKDFPSVKLTFNHIMFDLVPAYKEEYYWMKTINYFIPSSSTGWTQTVPKDVDKPLAELNQNLGNNSVRNAVRLCKHWNASSGYPLESYLMEKDAIHRYYGNTEDTYSIFKEMLDGVAGRIPGVKQALEHIRTYEGGFFSDPQPEKELQWVKKLLPGLPG